MSERSFDQPIHLLCSRKKIAKIKTARDGFDFLLKCRVQEGPIFESTLAVCFAALANPSLSSDAHRALITFAHIHGYLNDFERIKPTKHTRLDC